MQNRAGVDGGFSGGDRELCGAGRPSNRSRVCYLPPGDLNAETASLLVWTGVCLRMDPARPAGSLRTAQYKAPARHEADVSA